MNRRLERARGSGEVCPEGVFGQEVLEARNSKGSTEGDLRDGELTKAAQDKEGRIDGATVAVEKFFSKMFADRDEVFDEASQGATVDLFENFLDARPFRGANVRRLEREDGTKIWILSGGLDSGRFRLQVVQGPEGGMKYTVTDRDKVISEESSIEEAFFTYKKAMADFYKGAGAFFDRAYEDYKHSELRDLRERKQKIDAESPEEKAKRRSKNVIARFSDYLFDRFGL